MSTAAGPSKIAGRRRGRRTANLEPPRRHNLDKETDSQEEIRNQMLGEACPWSHLLQFHNEGHERGFVRSLVLSCERTDRISAIIPLILTPIKGLTSDISHPLGFFLCLAVFYVAIPLFMLWLMHFHANFYTRNRSLLPTIGRPVIAIGCAATTLFETLWLESSPLQMLGNIAAKTCIVPLITTTFGMRLPFSHHLIVQLTANLLSFFWVNDLNGVCMSDSSVAENANALGYFTERLIMFPMFPMGGPPMKPGQFSCRLVGLFYHMWLGFVVPTLLLYCIESWARSSYFEEYVCNVDNQNLEKFRKASVHLAGLVFIVGTQLLWLFLKMLVDIAESGNNCHLCVQAPF